jgi:hypothetical protein
MSIRSWAACVSLTWLALLGTAHAADAVRGKVLFWNTNGAPLSCGSAGCHAGFPAVLAKGIAKGSNPASTLNAIANNKGGMGTLSAYVNNVDADDIAAYIANPAAAAGSPAISLSATSLTFAAQTIGTSSAAQTVTVSNTGTAPLTLSGLTLGGAASADFARAGTCTVGTSVAASGSCSIQLTFTPSAAGARSASLTIAHNASGGGSTVTLAGTGSPGPAAASVTPATLSFTQTVGSVSTAQALTVANSGGQPLTVNTLSVSGANASEFSIAAASTCAAGTVINGGANCRLQLTFAPAAIGTRTATLSIAHSATASPATVTLNGTGTANAQPAISLSSAALSFGTQSVGSSSTAQTVTLTNSGQAALTLGALTLGGAASGDFTRTGTCAPGATVAASGSCTIQMSFAPTAVGTRSGTLTIASNANNGNGVVSLSGSGVQYLISVNPTAATLQAPMGTTSAPVQAVVANAGASPLMVSSIAVSGPFLLQTGSNSCGTGPMELSPGQSCNVYVAFQPTTVGAVSGEVMIESTASAAPTRIALTAQTLEEQTSAGGTPGSASNAGLGGCSVGAPDQLFDPSLALMLAIAVFVVLRRRAR